MKKAYKDNLLKKARRYRKALARKAMPPRRKRSRCFIDAIKKDRLDPRYL